MFGQLMRTLLDWLKPALAILTATGWVAALHAQAATPALYDGTAAIVFSGTSTLHDFVGRVPSQPFRLQIQTSPTGRVWSASASVKAAEMTTFHKERDEKMRQMFAADKQPLLAGTVQAAPVPDRATNGAASLKLKIGGQERALPVAIRDWKEADGHLSFTAVWEVSLKDYALKPPSVLGMIKVGDKVTVSAKVAAKAAAK